MSHGDLEDILRENYSMIRAVCWRILQDDSDTDDATQNALIAIARGLEKFDGRSSISTWIYRIATNAALDELRRRRRRRRFVLMDLTERTDESRFRDTRSLDATDLRAVDAVTAFESRDALNSALAAVPEEFRIPLVLRDVADLEYDDIAEILEIPPGTVRSRISRGRARLSSEWSKLQRNQDQSEERPKPGARTEPDDAR